MILNNDDDYDSLMCSLMHLSFISFFIFIFMFLCVCICEVTILPLIGFSRTVLRSSWLRSYIGLPNLRRISILTTLVGTHSKVPKWNDIPCCC